MNRKLISHSNYILRKVINTEDSLEILKNFIESVLNIKIKEIKLNPYLEKNSKYLPQKENFGIADVRIITNENEEINVGIQFIDGDFVQTKMLLYYSQIHLNQLEYEDKREFAKTITINILDYSYFRSSEYEKTIKIQSNEDNIKLEELELHTIELSKFTCESFGSLTSKEEWLLYLKGCDENTLKKIKDNNKNIKDLDKLIEAYWLEEKME